MKWSQYLNFHKWALVDYWWLIHICRELWWLLLAFFGFRQNFQSHSGDTLFHTSTSCLEVYRWSLWNSSLLLRFHPISCLFWLFSFETSYFEKKSGEKCPLIHKNLLICGGLFFSAQFVAFNFFHPYEIAHTMFDGIRWYGCEICLRAWHMSN